MYRENERKPKRKGYYQDHPCKENFTCKVCGRLMTPENAGTAHRDHCSRCLSSVHLDIGPGDRASDCGGVGAQGRRMGHHPPLPPVRDIPFQPHCGG